MPAGGKRPGAGAPRGNLNALKTGMYSKRLQALKGALRAVPLTTETLAQLTGGDRRKLEHLGLALQYYGEVLLLISRGGSINDLEDPQLRKRALFSIPIKQSAVSGRRRSAR